MRFGAHVSISGSLDLAVDRALAIGCECLQIFYGSPRQWRAIAYPQEAIDRFVAKRRAARLDPLVAHAAYLVNLGAPDRVILRKSIASLLVTALGVERLEGLGAVTHLGSRMGTPRGRALQRVAASVRRVLNQTKRVMVLLEMSAGAGDLLGSTFEDLTCVLDSLHGDPRVGICLDSAHLFAAGWDVRFPHGVEAVVEAADRTVGWDRIHLFHLNDSVGALGSHRDRHANIGEGEIGLHGFRAIVTHPRIRPLAGIIETPGFEQKGPDQKNLTRLRRLRDGRRRAGIKEVARGRGPVR
jgi:deoxyribonuclease-4